MRVSNRPKGHGFVENTPVAILNIFAKALSVTIHRSRQEERSRSSPRYGRPAPTPTASNEAQHPKLNARHRRSTAKRPHVSTATYTPKQTVGVRPAPYTHLHPPCLCHMVHIPPFLSNRCDLDNYYTLLHLVLQYLCSS